MHMCTICKYLCDVWEGRQGELGKVITRGPRTLRGTGLTCFPNLLYITWQLSCGDRTCSPQGWEYEATCPSKAGK